MPFRPGQVVTNAQIVAEFLCSPQGGMRRSIKTNSLVLITMHTDRNIYRDRWQNGILNYVGMGQAGDQSFDFRQNRTLFESRTNGVVVHLFEVFEPSQYTYVGEVELAGEPRMERHDNRMVCVFPLRVKNCHLSGWK